MTKSSAIFLYDESRDETLVASKDMVHWNLITAQTDQKGPFPAADQVFQNLTGMQVPSHLVNLESSTEIDDTVVYLVKVDRKTRSQYFGKKLERRGDRWVKWAKLNTLLQHDIEGVFRKVIDHFELNNQSRTKVRKKTTTIPIGRIIYATPDCVEGHIRYIEIIRQEAEIALHKSKLTVYDIGEALGPPTYTKFNGEGTRIWYWEHESGRLVAVPGEWPVVEAHPAATANDALDAYQWFIGKIRSVFVSDPIA